ncbi:MAG: UDP-2,3-diacylglucosamine diphosphatase [endosymbiont of Galathealinum brachiosum]|uniref:UDP-2,3-diacylglucosamine hydrolase n=1 Tax=endosymbiont of Galathealinum brachiosum TaxID=2200906 RepID=A0A370DHP2_9GAMM|nr:MAG: UDP-2,3-diacylglucosamine diphosphatase [endosymbiont of Galathealinum brachiosum]
MAKHLFISDLHLAPERPDIIQLFVEFMNNQAAQAESLYILGDLVEYWLGDDDDAEGLNAAFNAMKKQSDNGLNIYLMHGNRDFLMGEDLAKRAGCKLIHEPYIANLNNSPALLLHGDVLCTDDLRYLELRKVLRSSAWKDDFLSKTLDDRKQIAEGLRQQSKDDTQSKSSDIMDVNKNAVIDAFIDNHVSLMIHGHTHRPAIHNVDINNKPAKRIVLGDWYSQGSVLEIDDSNTYHLSQIS